MTKKKHEAREKLKVASEQLVAEVFSGAWNEIANLKSQSLTDNPVLIKELERKCPGHLQEEYIGAFSRAVRDNR